MYEQNPQVWGIILAGGEGKRLQSFIHSQYGTDAPKQYCTFTGARSMLRHTIDRAEMLIKPDRVLTIVRRDHSRYTENQLADRPPGTVIVQPLNRETGPAAFSAYQLYHRGGLWNTMNIVGKTTALLALFKTYTPTLYEAFWGIRDDLGSSCEAKIIEKVYSSLSSMNLSYSILAKNPVGLRAVRLQGVYWNDWGDADRIRSDIQRFCTVKVTTTVSLPFAKISEATELQNMEMTI